MSPESGSAEPRRSTRIGLKARIEIKGLAEPVTCKGETVVVNCHGALISTSVHLLVGMRIEIHVILTDKRGRGQVVYVDPEWPRHCGIGLEKPQNIWGVYLPPADWTECDFG